MPENSLNTRRKRPDYVYLIGGLACLIAISLWVAGRNGTSFFTNSVYDSYTLQAMHWRMGRIALTEDRPWLELAIYQGEYYVSFPPVPTVPMWLLTFFFGWDTPSALVTYLYYLGGFVAFYFLAKRHVPAVHACFLGLFISLGGSLLDIAVCGEGTAGGVWYQAQLLGYLFTMLAFLGVDGDRPRGWALGLVAIALAVGCRPFNAVYVPVLLYMLYTKLPGGVWQKLRGMIPNLVVPAAIACVYGVYNYARFANPLEFGHSYLPEFAEEAMFSAAYLGRNLRTVLSPPAIEAGALVISGFGFGVYLTNPMVLFSGERTIESAARRERVGTEIALLLTVLLHLVLLMMHRTLGGWQYGTRYFCDALPALGYLFVRSKKPIRLWEGVLFAGLILFNLYGTLLFHRP